VLQTRQNHETFRMHRVALEERPDLHRRFGVVELPTIAVVAGHRVVAQSCPASLDELGFLLAPWLRGGHRRRAGRSPVDGRERRVDHAARAGVVESDG
jgi:hypothetical protein